MKIFILFAGKPRDGNLNAFAGEFVQRASRFASCEMREIDPRKFDPFSRHPTARKILLDPAGTLLDSAQFVRIFEDVAMSGTDLVFLVGGHSGLPEEWVSRGDQKISLSPMTFPHELARAILAEQIYRALATMNNHPYPR